jgi:imidazolonepropionase-like amidohydrolase
VNPEVWSRSPLRRHVPGWWEEVSYGTPGFDGEHWQEYRAGFVRMKEFVRRFHEAGGLITAGTDSLPFPAFSLHEELELLVEAGLSPMAALQAATRDAARVLRRDGHIGTVEEGKLADLVLLGANPLDDIRHIRRIKAVVVRGQLLQREDLYSRLNAMSDTDEGPVEDR